MSKKEKLINKLKNAHASFTWDELVKLLNALGYQKLEGSGSRVKFMKGHLSIDLHRPHPGNELKRYVKKLVLAHLRQQGDI
ncbi:MAG: type II toxin-antitoxin system HicA family toxin [Oleiphilus sp.]